MSRNFQHGGLGGMHIFQDDIDFAVAKFAYQRDIECTDSGGPVGNRVIGFKQQVNVAPFFCIVSTRAKKDYPRVLTKYSMRSLLDGLNLVEC